MNTQHTPGPWEIKLSQDDEGTLCDIGVPDKIARSGQHVCRIHGWGFDYEADKEQQANARLIAAAPELLTMLTRVMDEVMMSEEVFSKLSLLTLKQARDAINKAKGSPA